MQHYAQPLLGPGALGHPNQSIGPLPFHNKLITFLHVDHTVSVGLQPPTDQRANAPNLGGISRDLLFIIALIYNISNNILISFNTT